MKMNKEKKQYEVGDRVQIQSLEWYNKNKDRFGYVQTLPFFFIAGMARFCGMYGTIEDIKNAEESPTYKLDIDNGKYEWSAEMFVSASASTSETIIPAEYRKSFHQVLEEMEDLYKKKNERYGNSFGKTFEALGLVSAVTRISDKYNRLCALATHPEIDPMDESLKDTLIDMANYCVMTIQELRNRKQD